MCTVTYLPQDEGFLLTQNRDESPSRAASGLVRSKRDGVELVYPRDRAAGGTWIAISSELQVGCLINGAFQKHKHTPPYRRSRGLVLLDYFGYASMDQFADTYPLDGIEPFTMIAVQDDKLYDLRWDEQAAHLVQLHADESHLWSSCTLYPDEIQAQRNAWFDQWRADHPHYRQEDILGFHKQGGTGDPWNDLIMNRDNLVRTTSITAIARDRSGVTIRFFDLASGDEFRYAFPVDS